MDGSTDTTNWLQWLAAAFYTVGAAVSAHLYALVGSVRREAQAAATATRREALDGDTKLWDAHNKERDRNSDFRTAMAEKVAALPTKTDHQQMEARIMAAIRGRENA